MRRSSTSISAIFALALTSSPPSLTIAAAGSRRLTFTAFALSYNGRDSGEGSQTMRIPFGQGRAAAIAGIIIMALMIEGAIAVVIDDAWLWGLLALFIVCLFSERRGRLPWQERWWWKEFFGTKESNSSDK